MSYTEKTDLKSQHWCRFVMNQHTEEVVHDLGPSNLDVLEISGFAWKNSGFKSYEQVDFPEFDICKDRTLKTYDLIIAEQVFEHVRYPNLAAKNVFAMLKKGGIFLITTPFLIRYHPRPLDLWRWTELGLKAFLIDNGFTSVESYSWGNRDCATTNFNSFPDYDPEHHSLENEPDFPTVVWAFAKRERQQSKLSQIITRYKVLRRSIMKRISTDLQLIRGQRGE